MAEDLTTIRLTEAEAEEYAHFRRRYAAAKAMLERLTPRQREIVKLCVEGNTSEEIAAILGITKKTVESHRYAIHRTLELRNALQLATVVWAL